MPSPFPGMVPYLEGYLWPDVHQALAGKIRQQLTPLVRPRYAVRLGISFAFFNSIRAQHTRACRDVNFSVVEIVYHITAAVLCRMRMVVNTSFVHAQSPILGVNYSHTRGLDRYGNNS